MALLKQSTAYTRAFLLVGSSDHITGLTGAAPTLNLSMAGAAFASSNAVIAEIGNGFYKASLTSTDTRTLGDLALHFSAASADPTDLTDQVTANILGDTLPASVAGTVTAGTVIDKSGYSLSQAFPANFAALAILAGGQIGIDWGNVVNKGTANALSGTTINSSQSVITSAPVTVGTNNDKTGYALTSGEENAIALAAWTNTQTESYAALHGNPTPLQMIYEMRAMLGEKAVSATSVTLFKVDGATAAETFTLDSTSPSQIHRSA